MPSSIAENRENGQEWDMPTVKLGYADLIKKMQNFPSQIPYALANALTHTAQRCQTAIRGEMSGRFTLRNEWSQKGIVIQPATKATLISSVMVGDLWDYLKRQEGGALKVPINGRKMLAIPTLAARGGSNSTIIQRAMRPKQLLSNKKSETFLIRTKGGTPLIVQRRGKQLVTLYVLVPKAKIKDRLGLISTSQATALKAWPEELAKSIEEAVATAR